MTENFAKQIKKPPVSHQKRENYNQKRNRPEGKKPPLRIIPLGGLDEVGKNMTVVEYGDDIIVIDCGSRFPEGDLLGVELVVPDIDYLEKNASKIRGIFITHAHEDHIGALPYVLRTLKAPIFCTSLTAEMIKMKLSEHKNLGKIKINVVKTGGRVKVGVYDVEFIHVNHSVPDACALAIRTPQGLIVHTGDFKIDPTPVEGEVTDLAKLGQLGKEGVTLLMCESTNAERPGCSMSEKTVGEALDRQFSGCRKRIIVATFASNVYRISQIISCAEKYGRKVVVTGRSMEKIVRLATDMGYVCPKNGTVVGVEAIKNLTAEQTVILTTGSQGEPLSGLYRMAFLGHKQIALGALDKVLISATPIPGNEKQVYNMINELYRRGCEVVYDKTSGLHVSGHACREELKLVMALLRPRYFIPVHGEYRHLIKNALMAAETGVEKKNIFVTAIGKPVEIGAKGAHFGADVPSGKKLIDGTGIGDLDADVLKERTALSQSGMIVVSVAVSREGAVVSDPKVTTRGFTDPASAQEMMKGIEKAANEAVRSCIKKNKVTPSALRTALKNHIGDYMFKNTSRSPMVVPVIVDI